MNRVRKEAGLFPFLPRFLKRVYNQFKHMHHTPTFLVVDLFCGAGGVTTGFEMTNGAAKVIACINHDHTAILSHWANHPEIVHFEEDIRMVNVHDLVKVVAKYRAMYPDAKLILWASLECTNFSKAKGGLARDADSRTLANSLHKVYCPDKNEYIDGDSYIQLLKPDYIQIENVEEFSVWGPERPKIKDGSLIKVKNKHGEIVQGYEPIPESKGDYFSKWKEEICALGYNTEWTKLNSADYGAHTSRTRLFGCFAKKGLPMVWPNPTHHKTGANNLLKWLPVKHKIDFNDEGYSIFYRGRNNDIPKRQRKDLSPNTLERIYAGCIKHIAGGKKAFMAKYHGGKPRTNDLDKPLTVIDTQNRHAFVSVYHGNGDNTKSMDDPAPTITAADINAAVFIHRDFGNATSSSINAPAGTIMSTPKMNLVQASAFIDTANYDTVPASVEAPCPTILASRKYPYLLSLQYGGQMSSVDKPAPTILATSNKTPIYLVTTEKGHAIQVYETDSEIIVKLKEFMALYGIVDIKMRMLRVDELLKIQGFPDTYRLAGTQEEQKKFIGNSVVPQVVRAWALALHQTFINNK